MSTTYDNRFGLNNYLLDNTMNGGWSSYKKPQEGFWNNIMGNTETVNNLGSQGNNLLQGIGFDKDYLANSGFQKFLFDNGIVSIDPKTNGLNIVAGLDSNKISELQKNYTNSIASGTLNQNNAGSNTGLFGWGTNAQGQSTLGGATGIQWLGAGLGTATSLYGMYNANKSMKLARENFEEQKQLQRANYEMQAKAYNNNLRNQQSGRSFTGMSGSAIRNLGREYNSKKAREQY